MSSHLDTPSSLRAYWTMPCGHPVPVGQEAPEVCAFCYDADEARLLHALQHVHGSRYASEAQMHVRE